MPCSYSRPGHIPARPLLFLLALLTLVPARAVHAAPPQAPAPADDHRSRPIALPAGPLSAALAALSRDTGLVIDDPASLLTSMPNVSSKEVSGRMTPDAALGRLLDGTPFRARQTGPDRYAIEIAVAPQRVDVAGTAGPYRRDYSTTGARTMTALRDIPQTLTVIPRELLVDQRAQSVSDAVRNAPGVSIAQGEGNRDQLLLRGMNTTSDFFVNGIRDDQERFRDLYNVDTIEVLQGPAAVLFGRGGAGGVVNLVTRRAVPGTPSEASLELGAWGHHRATTRLTLPVQGRAAVGLSAMAERSGGFRDGYFLRRAGANPTFTTPIGRASSLAVAAEYLEDHRLAERGIPSFAGRPLDVDPRQFFGSPRQNDAQGTVRSVSASFEHTAGRLTVRNNLLVGRYNRFYRNVYPGSAASAAGTVTLAAYSHGVDRTNLFNQTDVVLRARLGSTEHVLLGGLEAGHQFQDEMRHTAAAMPGVPLARSQRDADFASAPRTVDRRAAANILGLYAQDQVTLSRRWKAVLGARLDHFAVRVNDHMPRASDLARTDIAVSPRAGLIYQPVSPVSLYASYSYTFLPSGQTLGLAVNSAQLRPENATNYEIGTKIDVPGTRLTLSAAVFRLARNNVRNIDPANPSRLVMTGQQRTEGFLLSAAGSLSRAWRLHAGYADLDARITRDTSAAPAGRLVGLVPRRQGSLWTTYELPGGLGLGGGLVKQTEVFTSFTNQVTLPAFARLDGLLYYQYGRYRLALNAENLLDRRYFPTSNGDNNISPGAPRNIQMTLRAIF